MTPVENMEPLQLFSRFLARTMGLHFSKDRLPELARKMTALAKEQGVREVAPFLIKLMSAPLSKEQMDILACTLTIGETYFLRDPNSYRILEKKLLPELIAARRSTNKSIRIWSAGCSTGEEPYTLAILLSRAIPDISDWRVTLLATDINPLALERGRQGIYGKWSFRNAPPWLYDYFTARGDGRYQVIPEIRKMVRFSHLNLADDTAMASGTKEMDLIFCRNVMLYFSAEQIERTMARFHDSLSDSGWLFVGPTEIDYQIQSRFTSLRYDGAFVLTKASDQQQAMDAAWLESPNSPSPRRGEVGRGEEWSGDSMSLGLPQHQAEAAPRPPGRLAYATDLPLDALHSPATALLDALSPAAKPSAVSAPAPPPPSPAAAEAGADPGSDPLQEAQALSQAGRYQQPADLALSCQERDQAQPLTLAARAYANIGRLGEAQECCKRAIDCDRLNAQNHYLLSIILEQQGDAEGAVRSLKHALFIDHDYLLAYFALGNLLRQCGEQRESERNFANALRLLERRHPHDVLPEAEGMTAGRLAEVIRAMSARD